VQASKQGAPLSPNELDSYKEEIRNSFEEEAHPFFASARLWDDGIIAPDQTRDVLGLSLAAAANAPLQETRFGVFRM